MADNTAEETSVERSHSEVRDIDAKLREATARNHALAAARRARGENITLEKLAEREAANLKIVPIEGGPRVSIAEGDGWRGGPMLAPDDNFRAAVIPPRFRSASIDNYVPKTGGQIVARDAVQQWLELVADGEGAMLALIGPTGRGKSHLLYAAANALLDRSLRCYARGWYKLADELRYGGAVPWSPKIRMDANEVRDLLFTQRVVLLDEVRPTAGTAFDDTELAKFACHAYDTMLPVMITTNVVDLETVMGPAAASRFTQLVIDGPDQRQQ